MDFGLKMEVKIHLLQPWQKIQQKRYKQQFKTLEQYTYDYKIWLKIKDRLHIVDQLFLTDMLFKKYYDFSYRSRLDCIKSRLIQIRFDSDNKLLMEYYEIYKTILILWLKYDKIVTIKLLIYELPLIKDVINLINLFINASIICMS